VDDFLGGSDDDEDGLDDYDDEDDDADGEGEFDEEGEDGAGRRHALMLHAAGVGATTRKRKLAKARACGCVEGFASGGGPRRLTRALRRPRAQVVLTEAYPESEFNLNPAPGSAGDLLSAGAGLRCGARRVRTCPCS
jgi:U3 small nucleolar RNA-associated protein 14